MGGAGNGGGRGRERTLRAEGPSAQSHVLSARPAGARDREGPAPTPRPGERVHSPSHHHASLCPRPPGPPASGAPARSRGRCPCLPEGGRGHGRTEQACGPPAPSAHRDGDRSCARPWPCGRGALPALCCALAGLPRSHRLLAYLVRQQAPFPPPNLPWVGLLTPPALVLTWVVSHTPPCPPRAPGAHPGCHLSRG